ncbi:AraC family transcriptional regulator N-terminal domain-containing protein [Rhizobium leguminosarum]|uniref:AraC family transcriptional regulator N-terminal domain-containing protein n=1 Tax=Rhizobium leguminosarum TaxID=384 RepID=UPI003D78BF08
MPSSPHREGPSVGDQTEEILSALHRVTALLDRPEDLGALLTPATTELYYRLLQGQHGATLRDSATGNTKLARSDG